MFSSRTKRRHACKKDTWLRWTFEILCLFVHSSHTLSSLSYPTPQQEQDLIILDALSRRSGPGYYGENSVMEMLARSITTTILFSHNVFSSIKKCIFTTISFIPCRSEGYLRKSSFYHYCNEE